MNVASLIGRLTREPELRFLPSGDPVCNFSIAVDGAGDKGSDGYEPGFFDIIVFGKQAETCAQYLVKGQQVAVEGRLRHHRWEADGGGKRSKVEIIANRVDFLAKPRGADGEEDWREATPAGTAGASTAAAEPDPDDGIPF